MTVERRKRQKNLRSCASGFKKQLKKIKIVLCKRGEAMETHLHREKRLTTVRINFPFRIFNRVSRRDLDLPATEGESLETKSKRPGA